MRTTIVGHIIWEHWELAGGLVIMLKLAGDIEILLVERVIVYIDTKLRPIVSVDHSNALAVDDVAVPAHETHLEPQDGRVATLVRQDELDSVAVRHPHKLLTKDKWAYFVNGIVTSKALTKVGV